VFCPTARRGAVLNVHKKVTIRRIILVDTVFHSRQLSACDLEGSGRLSMPALTPGRPVFVRKRSSDLSDKPPMSCLGKVACWTLLPPENRGHNRNRTYVSKIS
jgi:hypothetical protein